MKTVPKREHWPLGALVVGLVWLGLAGCGRETPLFTQLKPEDTGVTFANVVTESETVNPITLANAFNGGGLAAGDFNGDGKLDLYFTGNQVANALYLNRGNWHFTDVTKTAGVGGKGRWNNGAAVVDINGDGRLDLYVCAGYGGPGSNQADQFYINQGNRPDGTPVFRDLAVEYGLTDTTATTNAAFFDYDNDGDLDVYLLVDKVDSGLIPSKYRPKITDGSSPSNDRLYRNDFDSKRGHAVFTDVTRQAGITIEGYGLGLNICDINNDRWKDIYVTNDFISNDLLWINNRNGRSERRIPGAPTFTNRAAEVFRHTSFTAMGNDVVDLNNDGQPEIIALDMMAEDNFRRKQMDRAYVYTLYESYRQFGYEHQYKRNTLQLNLGPMPRSAGSAADSAAPLPVFSEVSLQTGLAYTDWSWTPLCFDADQDGYRDILVTNGYPRDLNDNDVIAYQLEATTQYPPLAVTQKMPQIRIPNYAFRNRGLREKGALGFEDVTNAWGLNQPSYSHSAVYGDFDGDGDLDVVVNNLNEPAFVYRNERVEQGTDGHHFLTIRLRGTRQNPQGFGSHVQIRYRDPATGDAGQQVYELSPYRGYLSCQEAVAHFGLGSVKQVAEVRVTWPDGRVTQQTNVPVDQVLTLDQTSARPVARPAEAHPPLLTDVSAARQLTYQHTEEDYNDFSTQNLLPHKFSQYGPKAAVGDLNGDGLDDVLLTAPANGAATLFFQNRTGTFIRRDLPMVRPDDEKDGEQSACLLFDADGDKDLDVLVGVSGYEKIPYLPFAPSQLWLNDGRGNLTPTTGALPSLPAIVSCAKAADYDRDGDLDLFIGGRVKPGYYPSAVSSYVLRNDTQGGRVRFTNVTAQVAPQLTDIGMVCDALWTDYDHDGWPDLLLAGEYMPLTFWRNEQGRLAKERTVVKLDDQPAVGWWNVLAEADLDGDGDADYVAGNQGLNTIARPTFAEPMRLYAGDLNGDGRYDLFPTGYFRRAASEPTRSEFPLYTRDDLVKQYLPLRRRFLTYAAYGRADMNEILTDEERSRATVLTGNYPATSWVENQGNGRFSLHPLPALAQAAPVFGVSVSDVNGDGRPDILLVGNDYGNNHLEGRQDALSGLVLTGNGRGRFSPLWPSESGFWVPGDAKCLLPIRLAGNRPGWLSTENQGKARLFTRFVR